MKVVTLSILVGLAVVGETQFRLPTLSSFFTGFRPLLLSFPRFRPRTPQRPALRLAGQYLHSTQQTVIHEPEVFSPVKVQPVVRQQQPVVRQQQPVVRQQQTHQPTEFSSSFISPTQPSPPQGSSRIVKHQHQKASRKLPHSHHQKGHHSPQHTKSSFRVVKSTAKTIKPTNRHGFEPLRPESILSTGETFQTSEKEIVTNIIEQDSRPRGKSIVKEQFSSNTKVENGHKNRKPSSFPKPFSIMNDNNIIGMLPPPPPSSLQSQDVFSQPSSSNVPQQKSLLRPPHMHVSLLPLPPPPFSLPKSNTSPPLPNTTAAPLNLSLFLLSTTATPNKSLATPRPITNGLPILNAGVLPLADESPNNFVAFPPFGNLVKLKDEISLQELFPPFPPNNNLFKES